MRDSFLKEVIGVFPSSADDETPAQYRGTASPPPAPVVEGPPVGPEEAELPPILETPE